MQPTHEVYTMIDEVDGEKSIFHDEEELIDFLKVCSQQKPTVWQTWIDADNKKASVAEWKIPDWWTPKTMDQIETRDEQIMAELRNTPVSVVIAGNGMNDRSFKTREATLSFIRSFDDADWDDYYITESIDEGLGSDELWCDVYGVGTWMGMIEEK